MISVVVATMWRYPPFLDFVADMVRLDVIQEVIIIDNDHNRTPEHTVLRHPKVRVFNFGKNIFVNPAWNYGANASTADKICILNDDIIFDLKLFYRVDDFFRREHGTLGISNGVVEYGQPAITNGSIEFTPFQGQACYGFGNLFFVHKQDWRDIPRGLDIWWGDIFVFEYFLFKGKQLHLIDNVFQYHAGAQTCGSVLEANPTIWESEKAVYDAIRPQMQAGEY